MRVPTWRRIVQTISVLAACALLTRARSRNGNTAAAIGFSVENAEQDAVPKELHGLTDPALVAAIDLHFHVSPDSYPRSIDAIDAAKLAKERGMRGAVLKHHYSQTAGLAYFAPKYVPEGSGDWRLTLIGVRAC